jgi:hypothetical protein
MGFWKSYACVCADKGTVARDYFLFLFFHGSTLFWAHILGAKRFRFLFVRRNVESWLIDCLQLYFTGNHALATESVAGATKLPFSAASRTLRSPTIRRSRLATTATAATLLPNTESNPRGFQWNFPATSRPPGDGAIRSHVCQVAEPENDHWLRVSALCCVWATAQILPCPKKIFILSCYYFWMLFTPRYGDYKDDNYEPLYFSHQKKT